MRPHGGGASSGPPGTERPEVAVGAVCVRDGRLLLVRRGTAPDLGLWSIPGGHLQGGETLQHAVEREVREETGLEVECGALIGWAQRIGADFNYVILDFAVSCAHAGPVAAGDDATEVAWVELSEVGRLPLAGGLAEFLSGHSII